MKVILQKTVMNLGDAGEIKDVAPGYAMNFLIPQKLVIPATASSRKHLAHQQRLMKLKTEKRMAELKDIAGKLEGKELEIKVKVGRGNRLFGSVTPIDISRLLGEEGYQIDKRKIEIGQPIKETGVRKIEIKLGPGLTSHIKLNIVSDGTREAEEEAARQAAEEKAAAEAAAAEERAAREAEEEAEAGEAEGTGEETGGEVAEEAPEEEKAE